MRFISDPKTRDWFLIWRDPRPVWVLTIMYLLIVTLGPKVMKNRQPYSLQSFMVVYNLGLVALSFYMTVEVNICVYNCVCFLNVQLSYEEASSHCWYRKYLEIPTQITWKSGQLFITVREILCSNMHSICLWKEHFQQTIRCTSC